MGYWAWEVNIRMEDDEAIDLQVQNETVPTPSTSDSESTTQPQS